MPVTVFLIISVITLCFPSTWSFGLSRGIATFTYKRLVQTCLHGSVDGDDSNCTTTTQHNVPPEAFKSHSLKGLQNWPALATGVLLGTGLTLFALIAPTMVSSLYPATSEQQETYYHTDDITAPVILFQNILSDLEVDYIDKIDPAKLFKTGMKAMLQSLDPYTEFEDLNTAKTMQESVAGKYGGVGLIIGNIKQPSSPQQMQMNSDTSGAPATESTDTDKTKKSSGVFVVDAFEGYAYDSNMRPGDRLVSIDSVECSGMDVEQVRDLLRGVPDTQVIIKYKRDDFRYPFGRRAVTVPGNTEASTVQESVLKRQLVRLSDVRLATLLGLADDGVGYINLAGFSSGAGRDFRNAMLTLRQAAPGDLKGLILDLRGNPGGLLDMAVEVASYLVPEGSDIVSARGKAGPTVVYRSSAPNIRPDGMRLVVLVNKGSASASEIVAAAVQDLDAGIVLGSTSTYGKGLVQKIIPLPYDSALKYTIARYFTPSGRCIQSVRYTGGRGVPDLVPEYHALPADHPSVDDADYINKISSLRRSFEQNMASVLIKIRAVPSTEPASSPGNTVATSTTADTTIRPVTVASPGNPSSSNSRDKGSSGGGGDLVTPENVNGGVEITPSERSVFRTLHRSRVVRDGGGIEPDILLAPTQVGPAEGVFFTQGTYPDFAKEYIRAHNVRRDIRAAALSEQITRNMDEVFASAPYLTSMRQYYVPLQDTGARHSKKSTSVEEYYANVGKMTSDSPTARPEKTTISALSIPFRDVNDALPAQRSSVERRQFGSSTAATRSGIARVPDRFFWGRARSVADRAQLFREFKQYMVQQLNSGEINLDAAFSAEERKLQSALESAGFDSSTGVVRKAIVPKLRDAFLSDMDLHRDSIVDGLERAILSSELPDRLVMLHGVLRDTQVGAAAKLARGEAVLPYLSDTASGESGDGGSDKIAKKIANKLGAMSRRANSVDLSGVSYGQILGIK